MKVQLLLDVINDMRSLADGLEAMAQAMADGDNQPKRTTAKPKPKEEAPAVTHETVRSLAVELSKTGKRDEVKALIEQYGVKNITAIAEGDLDSFYAYLLSVKEAK